MKERIIKTIVPMIVGHIAEKLVLMGVDVPPTLLEELSGVLTLFFAAIYYLSVVWLTKKWPALEVLLGSKKTPEYK